MWQALRSSFGSPETPAYNVLHQSGESGRVYWKLMRRARVQTTMSRIEVEGIELLEEVNYGLNESLFFTIFLDSEGQI